MRSALVGKIEDLNSKNVNIYGNKSIANRAIITAALSSGVSILQNIPECDDTQVLISAVQNLGVKIEKLGDYSIKIQGIDGFFNNIVNNELFCKIAGTTSRFLTSFALLTNEMLKITGEHRLLERPIDDLCDALTKIGCNIKYLGKNGCVPFEIKRNKEISSEVSVNCDKSSQFLSSILLVAPCLKNGLKIKMNGNAVSKPYINTTISVMEKFGASVSYSEGIYEIINSGYTAQDFVIEGDFSATSYFFGIASICGITIRLNGVFLPSIQGDSKIVDIFQKIGCRFTFGDNFIEISSSEVVKNIEINMEDMPDSAMTVICILAFADGVSKISGLSTLKNKETDRLLALHTELSKIGIKTEITADSITIFGNPDLKINEIVNISTYEDHRMAMCFAMIGTRTGNVAIENPDVVNKSMPEFWNELRKITTIKNI